MRDRFGREIRALRVSVTDRCDLRCMYCVPGGAAPACFFAASDLLSDEEIAAVVEGATDLGIQRVRLTGGEPLVRPGVVGLVGRLAALPGLSRIALTTNGQRLEALAAPLAEAGLDAVNCSIDAVDPARYAAIRRGGSLAAALAGVEAALAAGLAVKVNAVIIRGENLADVCALARLSIHRPLHVRFLEYVPEGAWDDRERPDGARFVPGREVRARLIEEFQGLAPCPFVDGDGPAVYYRIPGARGTIGFIDAVSSPPCARCNRIRLLADGRLKPCLYADEETDYVDLRPILRGGAAPSARRGALREAIAEAVHRKPERGARERAFSLRTTGG